ncbi:response regulator [Streptomyces sp. NPDC048305]|uniref:response regulator n=1 Tax=Streptomyces sp. NPDC048305 TaxID=3365532 RepID=UPI003724169B
MPDEVSRTSAQNWTAQSPASQHTSANANPYPAERSSPGFPAPREPAAAEAMSPFPPSGFPLPAPLRVVVADDNPVVRAGLGVLLTGRVDIEVVAEAVDGRQAYEMAVRHRPDVVLLDVRMPGVDGISALPHLVKVAPVMMLTYSRESEIVHEALRLGASGYLVHGEFTADQLVQAVRDTKSGRAHFTATAANALLAHMRQGDAPRTGPLPDGLGSALTAGVPGTQGGPGAVGSPHGSQHGAPAHVPVQPPLPPATRHSVPAQGLSQMQPVVGQSSQGSEAHGAANSGQHGLSSREVEVMQLIASGMSNQQIAATCFISEKTVKNHINRIFTKLHSGSRSEAIARWLGTAPGGSPSLGGR